MRGERAELKVRLAPALHRAAKEKAREAGISLNSYVVHVLAAAVGPEFFRAPENDGEPCTIAEHRAQSDRERWELTYARSAFRDHRIQQFPGDRATALAFDDTDALIWYREVYLPGQRAAQRAG